MNTVEANIKRIEWCDIYKGILILLVVIGHSTGLFNKYIYQFHMAAFFVISGYTSNIYKQNFYHFTITKFYKIMVPFCFLGISGNILFYIFNKLNILQAISTTAFPDSLQESMIMLFQKGWISCDWLGALWFLPVLFITNIIARFIVNFGNRQIARILIISIVIFCFAENAVLSVDIPSLSILAGIAQFYFVIGTLLKNLSRCLNTLSQKSLKVLTIMTLIVVGLWYICSENIIKYVVDWPSGKFNRPAIDLALPMFGITATYMFSNIIVKTHSLKKLFEVIGKNTLGIMSFHFVGFKIVYLALIWLNRIEKEDLRLLTPTIATGDKYWLILSIVSVTFSFFTWKSLKKVKVFRLLLGEFSGKLSGEFECALEKTIYFLRDSFIEIIHNARKSSRKYAWYVSIIIIVCFLATYIPQIAGNQKEILITFPYNQNNVSFGSGWLEQEVSEDYRWVNTTSEFKLFLFKQKELHIEGYIPDNVSNMSNAKVYINGNVVMEKNVESGQPLLFDIPINNYSKKYYFNKIILEFDGVRIPNEQDEDKRVFSAMISTLKIQ